MRHALVTGATGFIGRHLVRRLLSEGMAVKCLVRPQSRVEHLDGQDVAFVRGDVSDARSLQKAMQDVDVVYHLAGLTKSVSSRDLMELNHKGTRNVSLACSRLVSQPTLVVVSSLAAAGPSVGSQQRVEADEVNPVSHYGRSKRAGELAAMEFATEVPTTIVRPPIVIGEYDLDVFQWFQMVRKFGFHLAPGFVNYHYSMIHADDLASALILAADRGGRLTGDIEDNAGIYFAACEEVMTYSDLGRLIGDCVGRPHARMVHAPMLLVWGLALGGDLWSRIQKSPTLFNLDKAREAAAGAWACSADKLRSHTGFEPAMSLENRLRQTAEWYIQEKWL
jgi:dihydroflavonol-4-reductase